jgi:hypothetical protein
MRFAPALLVLALLSGCLVTLGAPLTRRVQPGSWRVEAGAGPSLSNRFGALDGFAYGYAGRALGRHLELGALPYFYSLGDVQVLALTFPLRWDPFPYSWPVHLVPFAGPLGFWAPGVAVSMGAMSGLGLSLRLGELAELYACGSTFLPRPEVLSSSVGVRFDLANGWELGLGAMFLNADKGSLLLAAVTVSTLLRGKEE